MRPGVTADLRHQRAVRDIAGAMTNNSRATYSFYFFYGPSPETMAARACN